jgi:prepilin signal peptidase PulO-like enzyme (type II secretory pathway)
MSTLQMLSGLALSVLVGWVAGGLGNWMATHLPQWNAGRRLPPIRANELPHYWTAWWYWRRQACPHCAKRLSLRAPLLELSTAAVFGFTFLLAPQEPLRLGVIFFYSLILLTILVIDLEHRLVLNVMLGPASIIVLLLNIMPGMAGIQSVVLGGLAGFGVLLLVALAGRGKMGAGDVKLAGLLGLMTGYPAIWSALALGIVLGGIAAAVLLVSRRATRKATMAYAPYLAVGALVTLWQSIY